MTGIDVELASSVSPAAAARRDNLDLFVQAVAEFQAVDGQVTLAALLAWLEAEDEFGQGLDVATPSEADSVKLLTVHRAKGLEWDAVFLVGVTERKFPSNRSRSSWLTVPSVMPAALRGDARDLPMLAGHTPDDIAALAKAAKAHEAVEELRLGYVAWTRARHRLAVSAWCWAGHLKTGLGPSPYLLATREGDQIGFVGQQGGQGVQGAGGLAEGPHLQPVAQQHDHDQQGQLPPELEVEGAEDGGDAGPEGDQDGQGDEQHHARLAAAQLGQAALQERPPAVEEHHRPEHGRDPLRSRELGWGEPEPLLDHLGVGDHRDGEGEAQPEPVAELGGMVPMPAMGAVPLVAAGRAAVLVRLGVLAVLVRRQLAGRGAVVAALGPVAAVVLVVHLAAPHGRSDTRRPVRHAPARRWRRWPQSRPPRRRGHRPPCHHARSAAGARPAG